ncbi:hypothetical protein MK489_24360 [Myxococcota bacterium]|nr:hypothetical protein [Myxococcota bacterium]
MFYESIGSLLSQAAEVLKSDDPDRPMDERGLRERRQITTLLRRIGAIWPELFQALSEESAVLEAALRRLGEVAREYRLVPASDDVVMTPVDPLVRYRQLHQALDELVILFHEHGDEDWAQEALHDLRRGLAEAAEIQGRLVDGMLAA